jgi:hypothetical protein
VLRAEAAGIPFAMLSPHISIRPLPGVPAASSGLMQPKTPEERAEVAAVNDRLTALLNEFLPALNEARVGLGLNRLAGVLDIFDRPDRVLLAVSPAFDFKADSLPDNFRYVGPLLDEPSWSKPCKRPGPRNRTALARSSPAAPVHKAKPAWSNG